MRVLKALKERIFFAVFILMNIFILLLIFFAAMFSVDFGVKLYFDSLIKKMSEMLEKFKTPAPEFDFDEIRAGFTQELLDRNKEKISKLFDERSLPVMYATRVFHINAKVYKTGDKFRTYEHSFDVFFELFMTDFLTAKNPVFSN